MRAPPLTVATVRTWWAVMAAPASQSHSNGGLVKAQTCRPSTKKVKPVTSSGCVIDALNRVGPVT